MVAGREAVGDPKGEFKCLWKLNAIKIVSLRHPYISPPLRTRSDYSAISLPFREVGYSKLFSFLFLLLFVLSSLHFYCKYFPIFPFSPIPLLHFYNAILQGMT